jgi:hypothetical protein
MGRGMVAREVVAVLDVRCNKMENSAELLSS